MTARQHERSWLELYDDEPAAMLAAGIRTHRRPTVARGADPDRMSADDILAAFRRHLMRRERADDTITTYVSCLRLADVQLPFGLLRATDDELFDWLHRPHLSNGTRCLYTTAIKGFYAFATDPREPRLSINPAAEIEPPKRQRRPGAPSVSDDQLKDLLTRSVGRYRVWVLLAAYAGLRCCEIAALDREHVTPVRLLVFGKGSKYRSVPTHPEVWSAVEPLPPGPVAVGRDGQRLDRQEVSVAARAHFVYTLGLTDVSMHRMRKWYGRTLQRRFRDLRVTQELLGHSDPATTMRYTEVAEEDKAAATHMLPAVVDLAMPPRAVEVPR